MLHLTSTHVFIIGILLAWLAGIRVYLTVFGIGLAGAMGWMHLPEGLQVTQSPWVLGVSGVLALVEFFADKIPGVDSAWDLLHTLLRVPAGAFLAAAAIPTVTGGGVDGGAGLHTGMLAAGALTALTSHTLKTATRGMINTSPEPVSNWTASIVEDATTVGALALLWTHPWVAFGLAMAVTVTVLLLMWWLWRKLTRLHHHLRDAFHGKPAIEADSGGDQSSAA